MNITDPQNAVLQPKLCWYRITSDRVVIALLAVEALLWLSERFGWLPWHKGYAVLTAVATVAAAMVFMGVWFALALLFRRRFQFSIGALLVLTVVVAVPSSWLAVEMTKAKEQRTAVQAIQEEGGYVIYDYEAPDGLIARLDAKPSGPAWLRQLLSDDFFTNVTGASFNGDYASVTITDAGLVHLKGLTQLKTLAIESRPVTNVGLEYIKGLTNLQRLHLDDTQVTDSGLECLKEMTQLQTLNLNRTPLTGVGLTHIKKLTQLEQLFLSGTRVTDTALNHLKGMTQLKELELCGAPITGIGLKFIKELPQIQKLILSQTQVTGPGLEHLKELPQFQQLDLSRTQITDAGLEYLNGASQLRHLDIHDTPVTDTGLDRLKESLQLGSLEVYHTQVTAAGVMKFQQAFPTCTIRWWPRKKVEPQTLSAPDQPDSRPVEPSSENDQSKTIP